MRELAWGLLLTGAVACNPGQVTGSLGGQCASDSECAGLSCCSGSCVDTANDSKSCGACGAVCGTSCAKGICAVDAGLPSGDGGPVTMPDAGDADVDAGGSGDAGLCQQAGALIVYAIQSPAKLDWSTPLGLLNSAVTSTNAGTALVDDGGAVLPHSIGHVNLELDCGAYSFPLTGQTGASDAEELSDVGDGVGILMGKFQGSLNEFSDSLGDNADTLTDVAARQATGNLFRIKFLINQQMCIRLKTFHDQYVAMGAYTTYGSFFRPRRFEGAGCAVFGAGVIDVGGLLPRSQMTPTWSRNLFIGSARYSNLLGSTPYFPYGSNTVNRDSSGVDWIWPSGVNVPAPNSINPIYTLYAWNGVEDSAFSIPGVTLSGPMKTSVPFSLVDPSLMVYWGESVWQEAMAQGSATAMGATWTADMVEGSEEIVDDATCLPPQTIPFASDNDDLFLDSDAP